MEPASAVSADAGGFSNFTCEEEPADDFGRLDSLDGGGEGSGEGVHFGSNMLGTAAVLRSEGRLFSPSDSVDGALVAAVMSPNQLQAGSQRPKVASIAPQNAAARKACLRHSFRSQGHGPSLSLSEDLGRLTLGEEVDVFSKYCSVFLGIALS